jgi:NADH-quinone oxidoreductase subunit N
VDDLAGLGRTHPGTAGLMTVFLFSLIGMPLTAGFTGKFLVFFSAMDAPPLDSFPVFQILALLGVLNAGIAAWYYLRIVSVMYLRIALKPLPGGGNWAATAALWLCGLATLGLGLPPASDWLLQATRAASGRPASAGAVQP